MAEESSSSGWEFFFKASGAIVAVVAVAWGIVQFRLENQEKVQEPIRQRQFQKYLELINYASEIAEAKTEPGAWDKSVDRFNILYNGELTLVGAAKVEAAAKEFRNAAYEATPSETTGLKTMDRVRLRRLSRQLALACRNDLQERWHIDLGQLEDEKAAQGSK